MKKVIGISFLILVASVKQLDAYEMHLLSQNNDLGNTSFSSEEKRKKYELFGDLLFWHAVEKVEWSYTKVFPDENSLIDDFKTISFGWDLGFKVGVGYHLEHDQWEMQFYYTRFNTSTNGKCEVPNTNSRNGLFATSQPPAPAVIADYRQGSVNWNIAYNMFDWELRRDFWVSRALLLRPILGLKGGWIDQNFQTQYFQPNFFDIEIEGREQFENNFWGVGSKFGMNGKWSLGNVGRHSFSLVSDFSGAFLWGHWSFEDKFTNLLQIEESLFLREDEEIDLHIGDRNFGALVLQGLLGIAYDAQLNHRAHLAIQVGYEFQDWFNQYQIIDNISGPQNRALTLQGLTANVLLNF